VALALKGYRPAADTRVPRITCAWAPVPGSKALLATATILCRDHRAPLRLATLVVRDRQMYPSGVGYDIENMVANQWRASAQEAQREVLATLPAGLAATGVIGDGPGWRQALDSLEWLPGEQLLVGSSHRGAIARILLGADSSRIIRSARVPVIVLPRGAEPAVVT
jgi:nucleotide-binding universal stress UspA family protein